MCPPFPVSQVDGLASIVSIKVSGAYICARGRSILSLTGQGKGRKTESFPEGSKGRNRRGCRCMCGWWLAWLAHCDSCGSGGHVTYPHRPHAPAPPSIALDPSPEISIEKCEYTQIANEIRGNCPHFDPFSGGSDAV